MSENNYEFLGGVVLADANGEPYAAGTVVQGQPVILACTIEHGHTGAHQAYYADRLHRWH